MFRATLYFAILSLAVLAGCGDSGQPLAPLPTAARLDAFTLTTSEFNPTSLTTFVPCANGGAGEDVQIERTTHDVFHVTVTPNGDVTAFGDT